MNQQSQPRLRSGRAKMRGNCSDAPVSEIDELFEANLLRLKHVALRVLRHREDSEDAVQDGLLSAFIHLDQFRGQARFSTWLHSIVVNAALIKFRKQKARPTASLDEMTANGGEGCPAMLIADGQPSSEERFARREQFHMLAEAIENLPKIHRVAVRLCNIEGLTVEEAARDLGISIPALKTRLFRARWLISNHIRVRHLQRRGRSRHGVDAGMSRSCDYSQETNGTPRGHEFQVAAD